MTDLGLNDLSNAVCGGWFSVVCVSRYHSTLYCRSLSQPCPQEDLMKAVSVTVANCMETVNVSLNVDA